MGTTRRERLRQNTKDEIKAIAVKQMAEQGSSAVSLRAIAREMGVTVTALYRYYANYDDLITDLIVDSFNALADAMEHADGVQPPLAYRQRLTMILCAYRAWALDNQQEFSLIYGTPIPNYVAPRERTVPAVQRGFVVMIRVLVEAQAAGQLKLSPSYETLPASIESHLTHLIAEYNFPISTHVFYLGIVCWTAIHGTVMLEVFNHLSPTIGDSEAFYLAELEKLMTSIGL